MPFESIVHRSMDISRASERFTAFQALDAITASSKKSIVALCGNTKPELSYSKFKLSNYCPAGSLAHE